MAKGKKKKDKKKKEAVGAFDAIIAGDYADAGAEKAAAPQIGPGGKLLIEKILAQGIDAQKTEEVEYYKGPAGCCKKARVTNHTVKQAKLHGCGGGCFMCIVCALCFAIIGLAVDIAVSEEPEPKYHLWAIFMVIGFYLGCLCVCCFLNIWRKVETLETRLITDIEMVQYPWHLCRANKRGKIIMYTMDPSTPVETVKVPGARDVFEKIRHDIDRMRGNADQLIEEVELHKRAYGFKVLACGPYWGIWPRRDYDITSRFIKAEETNMCRLRLNQTAMARVYDLYMTENVLQVCGPVLCRPIPPIRNHQFWTKGRIVIYTFDRGNGHLTLRPKQCQEVFERIRGYVDAKNACTYYWTQAKTLGIVHGHFQKHTKD